MTKAASETTIDTTAKVVDGGLKIDRRYTTPGVDPFDELEGGSGGIADDRIARLPLDLVERMDAR